MGSGCTWSQAGPDREAGQCQAQEYEALLNIRVRLGADLATYHRL